MYDTACIHCEKYTVFIKVYHSCTVKIREAIICLKFYHGLAAFQYIFQLILKLLINKTLTFRSHHYRLTNHITIETDHNNCFPIQHSTIHYHINIGLFYATFNNILAIFRRLDLLVEETRGSEENTDMSQVTDKLYHIMVQTLS